MKIIAVGFGFQRGSSSSIRIRTYDRATGDMLSEDTFDLNVVGGEARDSEPVGDRVFAGAVDLTTGALGNFPMRVYDAQSGRYLWQGHLNFVDMGSEDPGRQVHTRRSGGGSDGRVALVADHTFTETHSQFWVRAVDPATGKAIWQQSFQSAAPAAEVLGGEAHTEPGMEGSPSPDFEIVVRSYERESGKLLWSDRLSTRDPVEDMVGDEAADHAQPLPLFRLRAQEDEVWL